MLLAAKNQNSEILAPPITGSKGKIKTEFTLKLLPHSRWALVQYGSIKNDRVSICAANRRRARADSLLHYQKTHVCERL